MNTGRDRKTLFLKALFLFMVLAFAFGSGVAHISAAGLYGEGASIAGNSEKELPAAEESTDVFREDELSMAAEIEKAVPTGSYPMQAFIGRAHDDTVSLAVSKGTMPAQTIEIVTEETPVNTEDAVIGTGRSFKAEGLSFWQSGRDIEPGIPDVGDNSHFLRNVILMIVSGVGVVIAVVLLIIFLCRSRKKKEEDPESDRGGTDQDKEQK